MRLGLSSPFYNEKTEKLRKLLNVTELVTTLGLIESFDKALILTFPPPIITGVNIGYGFWNSIFLTRGLQLLLVVETGLDLKLFCGFYESLTKKISLLWG